MCLHEEKSSSSQSVTSSTAYDKKSELRRWFRFCMPILICLVGIIGGSLLILRKTVSRDVLPLQYYHDHMSFTFLVFAAIAAVFWLSVRKLRLIAMWSTGCTSVTVFILARLMRDAAKLTVWNWQDICVPVLALVFVAAVFAANAWCRYQGSKVDAKMLLAEDSDCKPKLSQLMVNVLAITSLAAVFSLPLTLRSVHTYVAAEAAICVVIFVGGSVLQHILQEFAGWKDYLVSAFLSAQMFYIGRELRDYQQSIVDNKPHWDAPGFVWPFYGLIVVFVVLQLAQKLVSWICAHN